MDFFCYHRDRPGSAPLRNKMVEEHWSYMDQFATTMTVRGPTFTSEDTLTGSVHILELPDPAAARTFAFEEPCYQAGAYRDVMLRRWQRSVDQTIGHASAGRPDRTCYLVLGFTLEPAADAADIQTHDQVIASGLLLSDDGSLVLGAAVLLEALDADAARQSLSADRFNGIEIHRWRTGGRST